MFAASDTIVAIATPVGRAGIGIVRLSGADAHSIGMALADRTRPFEARYATFTTIGIDGIGDQVVMTAFAAPHSYTGEDVLEISAHGSPVLLAGILRSAIARGARLAEPGEFTLRAFLNGRVDLVQAEAVRDLVDAVTPLQARAAFDQLEGTLTRAIGAIDGDLFDLCARLEASLDFPEEGYHFVSKETTASEIARLADRVGLLLEDAGRGRLVREGLHVVLAGRPNSGKSSLFNALAGEGRAIVTDVPGTTRDLLTETVDLEGVPVTVVDTAGVRAMPADAIEAEGIARAQSARRIAAVVVVVLDASAPLEEDDRRLLDETSGTPRVVAANKSDLPAAWTDASPGLAAPPVRISALRGDGLDRLRREIVAAIGASPPGRDVPAVTNIRHAELLRGARESLQRAAAAASAAVPEEFVLADVNAAREQLEEVTGRRTADDVLAAIFSKFCIGK